MWRTASSLVFVSRPFGSLCFRSLSRALPKRFIEYKISLLGIVDDFDIEPVNMPQNVHREKLQHSSLYPQTAPSFDNSDADEISEDHDERGNITFDFSRFDSKTRSALSKAYSILSCDKTTEEEQKDINDILDVLQLHPNFEHMSPDQLLDVMDLKPETREAVNTELKRMVEEAEECLKDVSIQNILPESQVAEAEFVKGMNTVLAKDPSLKSDANEWIQNMKARVGDDLSRMETLSDEEFAALATPPPRLRAALKEVLPPNVMNLDADGDVVRFFSNKKCHVCYSDKHNRTTETARDTSMHHS
mgnify:CR=1 FL=1